MIVDVVLCAMVAVLGVFGFFRGLFSQVWGLGALVVAYAGTPPAIALMQGALGWPGAPDSVFSGFLINLGVGFGLYVCLVLVGRLLEVVLIEQLMLISAGNKVLGGLVGVVKGALIALAVLWGIQFTTSYLMDEDPRVVAQLEASALVFHLGGYNPLNFIYLNRLKPYLVDPTTGQPARPLPKTLNTPELSALVTDSAFSTAVQARDYKSIVLNPTYRAAMRSPRSARMLNELF